jgi:hypothetical protein
MALDRVFVAGPCERVVIVGGPSRGKSTTAHEIHERTGAPVFCGDPASTVRFQKPYTVYLPEGMDFGSESSRWIVDNWLRMPGPWVLEGHVMARVLRKWMRGIPLGGSVDLFPCDRVIVLDCPAHRPTDARQEALHTRAMKIWNKEIGDYFAPIAEVITEPVPLLEP